MAPQSHSDVIEVKLAVATARLAPTATVGELKTVMLRGMGKSPNGHALSFGGRLLQDGESLAAAGVKNMDSVVLESDVCPLDVVLPNGQRVSIHAKKSEGFAKVRETVAAMAGLPLSGLGHFVVRSLAGEPSRIGENRTVGEAEWLARGSIELLSHPVPVWATLPRPLRAGIAASAHQQARLDRDSLDDLTLTVADDILHLVLAHMPTARDHCVLAAVCHSWRQAVLRRRTLLIPAPAASASAATPTPAAVGCSSATRQTSHALGDRDAKLTAPSFAAIVSHLPCLEAVDISGRRAACDGDAGLCALAILGTSCPALRVLRLRGCAISDAGLLALAPRWGDLAVLDLADNAALTDTSVCALLGAAPRLGEFSLTAGSSVRLDRLSAAIRAAASRGMVVLDDDREHDEIDDTVGLRSFDIELMGSRAPAVAELVRACDGVRRLCIRGRITGTSAAAAPRPGALRAAPLPASLAKSAVPLSIALPHLEELEWCAWGPDTGLLGAVLAGAPSLRAVTLSPTTALPEALQTAAERLPRLDELRLRESRLDDQALIALAEQLGGRLRALEIASLRTLHPATVATLLTRCTAANELRLGGIQGALPAGFTIGCTEATVLALSPCAGAPAGAEPIAIADLAHLVAACPRLRRLELPGLGAEGARRRAGEAAAAVEAASFVAFVAQLPRCLEALDLSGWCALGDATAAALAARCPGLRELCLDGTYVSGAGLAAFLTLHSLERLSIRDTEVAAADAAAFAKRSPASLRLLTCGSPEWRCDATLARAALARGGLDICDDAWRAATGTSYPIWV